MRPTLKDHRSCLRAAALAFALGASAASASGLVLTASEGLRDASGPLAVGAPLEPSAMAGAGWVDLVDCRGAVVRWTTGADGARRGAERRVAAADAAAVCEVLAWWRALRAQLPEVGPMPRGQVSGRALRFSGWSGSATVLVADDDGRLLQRVSDVAPGSALKLNLSAGASYQWMARDDQGRVVTARFSLMPSAVASKLAPPRDADPFARALHAARLRAAGAAEEARAFLEGAR